MNFKHFTAGKDDSGRRLDRVLRAFLTEESLSAVYKSIRKGLIKVGGRKRGGDFRISEGDDIQIADFLLAPPRSASEKAPPLPQFSLESHTVFRNEAVLILDKPYNVPVQPGSSSHGISLSEIVQRHHALAHTGESLSFRTGPLHRLDRKTTGLIVFSQNLEGARWFSKAMRNHSIQKTYLAVVEGHLTESMILENNIQKSAGSSDRGFRTVAITGRDSGKYARTEVSPVRQGFFEGREITLARIVIKTGRTHQIRIQCAHNGFPLLGDTAYGAEKVRPVCGQDFFLHAAALHFPPENPLDIPGTITAPPPEAFRILFP